jgi:hypothetical protein
MAVSRYIEGNCVLYEELIESTSCVIIRIVYRFQLIREFVARRSVYLHTPDVYCFVGGACLIVCLDCLLASRSDRWVGPLVEQKLPSYYL